MEAKEKYYRKLVDGYLDKTLTKRELAIFFDLLAKGELDFYLEEDMMSNIPSDMERLGQSRFRRTVWFSAAAALLVLFGLAFYFTRTGEVERLAETSETQVVQPGSNHAVLTLSDGKQIILDGSDQQEDIQDGQVSVVNSDRGMLKYDLSKLSIGNISEEDKRNMYHTIETPRGGTYYIILPDGSQVWLNSLSKIKFPVVFEKGTRMVEMEGEVFFDVENVRNQPFVVKSKEQEIKVLGTSFNVNAYKDEPFVRTTLVTGKIELQGTDATIKLNPGEEVLNTGNSLKIQNADLEQTTAWKDGYFRFDKVDIETLMRQMSRWYNVNVKYTGPISNERFVGKIKRSEDIQKIIKIFNEGGMDITLNGRTLIVRN